MMCCDGWFLEEGEVADGTCPDCGGDTLGGQATEGCAHSPCICRTCNDCPCDGSC